MTRIWTNITIGARLAGYHLWRMKVLALVAILVVALPVSTWLVFNLKPTMEAPTTKSERTLGFDTYETRFQVSKGATGNFAELDRGVKAVAGDDTVTVVSASLGTAKERRAAGGEWTWITWGPAQGKLAQTSTLVSGRWPQNSREVLVSDTTVKNGAVSTGTVSLVVNGAPAQDYTIVGVGWTVIGKRHATYTSLVDDELITAAPGPDGYSRATWLVPGQALSPDKISTIEQLGLHGELRNKTVAPGGKPVGMLLLAAALTFLACVVVSFVFVQGLGKMRQALGTIIQNGGNRLTVVSCGLAQGVILGVAAAAVVSLVGIASVVFVVNSPPPETHPYNTDLRPIPFGFLAGVAAVVALCTCITAVIPALSLKLSDAGQHLRTYIASDADVDLKPVRLLDWTAALNCVLLAFWATIFAQFQLQDGVVRDLAHDGKLWTQLIWLGLAIVTLVAIYLTFQRQIGYLREVLYRRGFLSSEQRQSLASGRSLIAMCACVTLGTSFFVMVGTLTSHLANNTSGWTHHKFGSTQQQDHAGIESTIRAREDFQGRTVETAYTLKTSRNTNEAPSDLGIFHPAACDVQTGTTVAEVAGHCGAKLSDSVKIWAVSDKTLTSLYHVSPDQLARMHQGSALRIEQPDDRAGAEGQRGSLLLFEGFADTVASEHQLTRAVQVDVIEHDPGKLPWLDDHGVSVLMSTQWLKSQNAPLVAEQVLIRSRFPLNLDQAEWLNQVTGDDKPTHYARSESWPQPFLLGMYGFMAVFMAGMLALSSYGLAGSLYTMRTLGHGFWKRYWVNAKHCLTAGTVATLGAVIVAVLITAVLFLPLYIARPPYARAQDLESLPLLLCALLIPLVACIWAIPCTWLWSLAGKDSAAKSPPAALNWILGLIFLVIMLFSSRFLSYVW